MPYTEKQRKAAFAALNKRSKGQKSRAFSGMTTEELRKYAHHPLEKRKHK